MRDGNDTPAAASAGEGSLVALSPHLLQELRIGNAKSFVGEHTVPLAPLTLLFGPNAAGKSTVIQSLLLLAQSLEANAFEPEGPKVNVRNFRQFVSGHDVEREVTLGASFAMEVSTEWIVGPDPDDLDTRPIMAVNGFEFRFRQDEERVYFRTAIRVAGLPALSEPQPEVWEEDERGGTYVQRWSLDLSDPGAAAVLRERIPSWGSSSQEAELLRFVEFGLRSGALQSTRLVVWNSPEDWQSGPDVPSALTLVMTPGDVTGLDALSEYRLAEAIERDLEKVVARWRKGDLEHGWIHGLKATAGPFAEVAREGREILQSNLRTLGPIRPAPRCVSLNDGSDEPTALDLVSRLHRSERLLSEVNAWLDRLEVPYDISVDRAIEARSGTELGYSFELTDNRSQVKVSLSDVGYGVSQLLPIVTECLGRSGQVVCIEQPELHLHPRLQSNLGDLFVEAVIEQGNQIIAETHSENLLLRVRRLVREGTIAPEDVSVLYVDNQPGVGATVERLRLGRRGELLDPWPTGFFDDSLADVLGGRA